MPLVPPYIDALSPYVAGRNTDEIAHNTVSRVFKLASNENPLGASPMALDAIRHSLDNCTFIPQPVDELRRVLAEKYETKMDNVIVGSGSDAIMANIIRTFLCDEDEVLTTEAAFIGFQVLAKSRGVTIAPFLTTTGDYDLPALAAAINEHTKIIYLANPNNPTGTIFTRHQFDEFYGMCRSAC